MIRAFRFLLLGSLAMVCLMGTRAEAQKAIPRESIYKNSDWDFTLEGGQTGGVRIRDGRLYPGDKRLTNQVGNFDFDGDVMCFEFINHPKISYGEARLVKVADGKWEGTVVDRGRERKIVLKRP